MVTTTTQRSAVLAKPSVVSRLAAVLRQIGPSLLFVVVCLLAWTAAVRVFDIQEYLLPTPLVIAKRIVSDWDVLGPNMWVTLYESVIGFILGVLVGFLIALPIAFSNTMRRMIYPLLVASQAVPKLAIAPLLVVWLGFGVWPKITVTVLLVFFPVAITTADGLMRTDPNLLRLLRSVNASPLQTFTKVKIPDALPHVMSGLRIGITLAVVGAVVGEWVGASKGLGYVIISANSQLDSVLSFAAVILLVLMGIVLFMILELLGRLIAPWERHIDKSRLIGNQ